MSDPADTCQHRLGVDDFCLGCGLAGVAIKARAAHRCELCGSDQRVSPPGWWRASLPESLADAMVCRDCITRKGHELAGALRLDRAQRQPNGPCAEELLRAAEYLDRSEKEVESVSCPECGDMFDPTIEGRWVPFCSRRCERDASPAAGPYLASQDEELKRNLGKRDGRGIAAWLPEPTYEPDPIHGLPLYDKWMRDRYKGAEKPYDPDVEVYEDQRTSEGIPWLLAGLFRLHRVLEVLRPGMTLGDVEAEVRRD